MRYEGKPLFFNSFEPQRGEIDWFEGAIQSNTFHFFSKSVEWVSQNCIAYCERSSGSNHFIFEWRGAADVLYRPI